MIKAKIGISQSTKITDEIQGLIKIIANEQGQQLVSGRELYESLKIKKDFTPWMKTQLELVDAVESEDYSVSWYTNDDSFKEVVRFNGSVNSMARKGYQQDYILTINIAKEICMVVGTASRTNEETRQLSKQVRKYFIKCEEIAKEKLFQQRLDQELQKVKREEVIKFPLTFYPATLKQMLSELEAPQDYTDALLPEEIVPISVVAKDYGMTAQQLNKKLGELGIQYKTNGWLLHSHYQGKKYTITAMYVTIPVDGEIELNPIMYWTLKGRLFIYEELKKVGILLLMERAK